MRKSATTQSRRTLQRRAQKETERQVAEIINRAVCDSFDEGIRIAAALNPRSHTGHFRRMFWRLIQERVGY